jgi:hypothetical protein
VSLMPQLQITLRFVVTVRDLFDGILEVMMLWPLLEITESDFLFLLREFQFGIKSTAQGYQCPEWRVEEGGRGSIT